MFRVRHVKVVEVRLMWGNCWCFSTARDVMPLPRLLVIEHARLLARAASLKNTTLRRGSDQHIPFSSSSSYLLSSQYYCILTLGFFIDTLLSTLHAYCCLGLVSNASSLQQGEVRKETVVILHV